MTGTFEIQQAHFIYDTLLNNYPPSKCVEVGRREIFEVSLLNKWKLVPVTLKSEHAREAFMAINVFIHSYTSIYNADLQS